MEEIVSDPVLVCEIVLVGDPVPLELWVEVTVDENVLVSVARFDGVGNGVLDGLPVGV